mgnify:FL=1|tara:strand:+ start:440 stop:1240 length:801 start_codon:yes stop_codon:yes gene_type:complete
MESFFEHQIGFDEYVTGNRFIDICDDTDAVFCKTDYTNFLTNMPHEVVVTHNSDYHIDASRYYDLPDFKWWFAQNKDFDDNRIIPVPIGLENMKLRVSKASQRSIFSSEVPGALQKSLLIDKVNSLQINKSELCYMNFNINTYPEERQLVWDYFSNQEWVTKTSNLSMEKFYFDIASHKFVISPRGNGVDCHRTWEALYLRTIPIVKTTLHMKGFSDLPILFVNDWSELTYNRLQKFYEHVQNTTYDLSKIKISYWKNRINEKLHI